jgi:cell division septation protein DedD
VLAVPPDPIRQAIADLERDPIIDFIRLDPAGKAVVAGRASPGTELVILDNGAQLGRAMADIYGLWTFISDAPLPSGRHEIALALESQGRLTILPRAGPAVASPEPQRPAEPAEEIGIEVAAGPAATLAEAQPPSEPAEAATAAQSPAEMPEESTAAAAASAIDAPAIDAPPQPAPKPARAAAPQVAAATPAAGSFAVQFISLSTPNAAQRAQGDLEKRFPDLLAGLEMFIDRTTLSDNRVVYRVRTGPFGSRADAQAACARFKTRGQDCLVARR